MARFKNTRKQGGLPRRITAWCVTLGVLLGALVSLSAAYNLMVGEYTVPAAAAKVNRLPLVEDHRTPPAFPHQKS